MAALKAAGMAEEYDAAVEALAMAPAAEENSQEDDHPSRLLLQKLILDEKAWSTLFTEWENLVKEKANWDTLLLDLQRLGVDRMEEKLAKRYKLTFGAAAEVVRVLARGDATSAAAGMCAFFCVCVCVSVRFCVCCCHRG